MRLPRPSLILCLLVASAVATIPSTVRGQQANCGQWQTSQPGQQHPLMVNLERPGSGSDCQGGFELQNGTANLPLGTGGYTLQLDIQANGAQVQWAAPGASNRLLLPGFPVELSVNPTPITAKASVGITGSVTLASVAGDLALNVVNGVLTLAGVACYVPSTEMYNLVTRLQTTLDIAARRVLALDPTGAKQELNTIGNKIQDELKAAGGDVALSCISKAVTKLGGLKGKLGDTVQTYLFTAPASAFDLF